MAELLLEILSEEIPARMQVRAAQDLERLVGDGLKEAGLEFHRAEAFVTPRRLALVVDGLPEKQPDVIEERRGPRVDAPDKAIDGFKGSLPEGTVIEERDTDKGTFLFAIVNKRGEETASILAELVAMPVWSLPWPKSMRWGVNTFRWVRPITSIVSIFDGATIPLQLETFLEKDNRFGVDIVGSNTTVGHRFLAPDPITVVNFDDYVHKLRAAKVVLDHQERCQIIGSAAMTLAEKVGLTLKEDHGLLHEVAGLVEWPVVLMGTIDEAFMDVPEEVLITSMRSHQKYFSCIDADGKLANRFIMVANTETEDGGASIVAGNERVLRARLSDAKFFWDQDRASSLASRAPALKDRIFHAKLGSLDAKVDRVQALAADIASFVPNADKDKVRSAARLSKCDLSTGMVGEFPELQGIMGRYYALYDGESEEVADAIAEHYSPLGPDDACPTKPTSVALSIADKLDSLVGFFIIDEKPTGSKDPFALRRSALGIIRLILENDLRLPLRKVLNTAKSHYSDDNDPTEDLLAFFADRLIVHLREKGVKYDQINAIFALGDEDDLVRLLARVDALSAFLASDDGGNLLTAYRRAANILRIEEKKDGRRYDSPPEADLFVQEEEKLLHERLQVDTPLTGVAIAADRFDDAMSVLAKLRKPVDAFFDEVTVNCDEPRLRENRLKLLNGIRGALDAVADLSQIEG